MKSTTPPKLAQQLLNWYAGHAAMEDLQGDLEEVYAEKLKTSGKWKADFSYWKHVISLLFSYALKKRKKNAAYSSYYQSTSFGMFKNYLKIALRNFSKHRMFTSLNLIGLALGMSVCLLALSIAVAIYQTDEWHENKERIYQVNTHFTDENGSKTYGSTFPSVGPFLEEKYPFIEKIVNIKSGFSPDIEHHGNQINFHGYFAGASFFEVFDFQMIGGDPKSALSEPNSIVLTRKVAKTLFKNEDPIGQLLETDYGRFKVTGVIENLKQTHFYFEVLASYSTYQQIQSVARLKNDWVNYRNNYVYLQLNPGTSEQDLSNALQQVSATAAEFHLLQEVQLESIGLTSVVPRWNISNALGIGWDQPSMLFFFSIGLLVLLPAVFNYTNLSVARALKRTKEIGVRKVIGAGKGQIQAQFIVETVLLSFLALMGSLLIFVPLKREFLNMVIAAEVLDTSMGWMQVTVFLVFALLVGLFAGIFPARFFGRLNPIHSIKGEVKNGTSKVSGIKKGLFVFQFFLSMVFIIGVGAIAKQYGYVLNQNHGFESDLILTVPFKNIDKSLALNELGNHPDVKAITSSSNLPGLMLPKRVKVSPNNLDTLDVNEVYIGSNFMDNMQMKLVWGEGKSLDKSTRNEERVLVNEQFLKASSVFNVQQDSLTFTLADGTPCRIVGIMEDFNFEPLSREIEPLLFRYSIEKSNYALLTVNSPDIKKTINELDAVWTGMDQDIPFEATFLNDEIERAYHFLSVQIKIFGFLSVLAITISCLGLLGMVAFTTENRTKEIAIRKIMGASEYSLYYLLTKDFIKLIMISAAIAIPFSYVFYDKLFLYFLIRYGSGLGVLEVVISIVFLFLVGFSSIYWQTSKVAKANPAGNLRYE